MTDTDRSVDALAAFAKTATGTDQATLPVVLPPPPQDWHHGAMALPVQRDEQRVLGRIATLAAAAGSDWYYRWPVRDRKKGSQAWVEGPSIKMANDLWRLYGNCDVDVRVTDQASHWLFHARFIDLETGASMVRLFRQPKSGGTMGDDAARREDIAFQIGQSKALRNVIVAALQTYADYALEEARNSLTTRIAGDIEKWRARTIERIAQRSIDIARIEAVVGRPAKNWLAPDIAKVIAQMAAIADGMASAEETFPLLKKDEPAAALDQFANTPKPAAENNPSAAGAGAEPLVTQPAPATSNAEAIDKVLAAAADPGLEADERLANIDWLKGSWQDRLEPKFHQQLFSTATKVAKGELTAASARKFLAGWKDK